MYQIISSVFKLKNNWKNKSNLSIDIKRSPNLESPSKSSVLFSSSTLFYVNSKVCLQGSCSTSHMRWSLILGADLTCNDTIRSLGWPQVSVKPPPPHPPTHPPEKERERECLDMAVNAGPVYCYWWLSICRKWHISAFSLSHTYIHVHTSSSYISEV